MLRKHDWSSELIAADRYYRPAVAAAAAVAVYEKAIPGHSRLGDLNQTAHDAQLEVAHPLNLFQGQEHFRCSGEADFVGAAFLLTSVDG